MIVEMITVGQFQENCYVIGEEESGTGILIDPGTRRSVSRLPWSDSGWR